MAPHPDGIGEMGIIRPIWDSLSSREHTPEQYRSKQCVTPMQDFSWVISLVPVAPDACSRKDRHLEIEGE